MRKLSIERAMIEVNDKERLLELLVSKALEMRRVTLSSGRTSDYYMDCKRVTLSAEGAYLTAKLMLDMIGSDVSAVGGLTLGADPIVSSIAVLSHLQGRDLAALIVRKEAKKHGTMSYVEGPALEKGAKVAVVEDVVTSGASLLKAIERIAAAGYQPVQALTILDRQEGGSEAIRERGYVLQALFSRNDLNKNI
ncbi:MAG: Orotate phosphoribosyltransferase [Methanosaeta sp. PtaU1.Bin016]|nr:MAG: Orotate phosphoribosyltransferase [Methanosaeta sp. PtaU1.Bin016]